MNTAVKCFDSKVLGMKRLKFIYNALFGHNAENIFQSGKFKIEKKVYKCFTLTLY